MPIQEREQWADECVEQIDEKRDAWLAIRFIRLLRGDRRALFQPTVEKALGCWVWSTLLPVVPVEFIIHGRNRSRSQKHDLWSSFVARSKPSSRPEGSEGFEVVRACASDQDGQAADTAVTVSTAISSRRHAI